MLKVYSVGVTTLSLRMRAYLHSLSIDASQVCEILRNSSKIRNYSSSRSSKVIDLCAYWKRICNVLIAISLLTLSRYWRIQLENGMFSPLPCLMPPLRGNPSEFLDETHNGKARWMELPCGKNSIILSSTVFDWSTRVTDRQADGRAKHALAC